MSTIVLGLMSEVDQNNFVPSVLQIEELNCSLSYFANVSTRSLFDAPTGDSRKMWIKKGQLDIAGNPQNLYVPWFLLTEFGSWKFAADAL